MSTSDPDRHAADRRAADAFAMILSCPEVPVRVSPDPIVSDRIGIFRPRRFVVPLPVRFRLAGTRPWYFGVTENLSQVGLLFRTGWTERGSHLGQQSCGAPIEVAVEIPDPADSSKVVHIQCDGRIARIVASERPGGSVLVGVAVRKYAVVPAPEVADTRPETAAVAPQPTQAAPQPSQAPPPPVTASDAPLARAAAPPSSAAAEGRVLEGVRRYPRAHLDPQSTVWADVYPDRGDVSPASGRLATLGPGGVFIELGQEYPLGSLLSLRFKLPPSFNEIVCWGVVRNALYGRGVGIEFSDLRPGDRDRIASFVTECTRH